MSGFGQTATGQNNDDLRFLLAEVITNTECSNRWYQKPIGDDKICTFNGIEHGFCNGDSGGPLTASSWLGPYLVGVVSYRSRMGCGVGYPDVYTRVSSFSKWINDIVGNPDLLAVTLK